MFALQIQATTKYAKGRDAHKRHLQGQDLGVAPTRLHDAAAAPSRMVSMMCRMTTFPILKITELKFTS